MIIIKGKGVFGAVGIGKILFITKRDTEIKHKKSENFELERTRFKEAKASALKQLAELYEKALKEVGEEHAEIFEIHQMLLEDEQALHPYEAIVRQELRSTLEKLLDELTPPRKAQILRLHNGLVDGTHYSFQKIADMLGISKERVRQINNQAFKELQEKMKELDLEAF